MPSRPKIAGSVRPYFGRTARGAASDGPIDANRSLLETVASSTGWQLQQQSGCYKLVANLSSSRRQAVAVEFDAIDEIGRPVVLYWSVCGKASVLNLTGVLKRNSRQFLLSFAVAKIDGEEMLTVRAVQSAEMATADGVREMVQLVAEFADTIEAKMSSKDRQ